MRPLLFAMLVLLTASAFPAVAASHGPAPPAPELEPNRNCPEVLPLYDQALCQAAHWSPQAREQVFWLRDVALWADESARCDVVGGPACADIVEEVRKYVQA